MTRTGGMSVASIVVVALGIVVTGGSGAALTQIGPWYRNLRKPVWNPPDWLFPPAWTLIFALLGCAIVLAWNAKAVTGAGRTAIALGFMSNLALNVLWSTLFFARHRPDLALVEVVFLWLSIVALILVTRAWSPVAPWLLLPYLAWVSFASVLNYRIVTLNRPFSSP